MPCHDGKAQIYVQKHAKKVLQKGPGIIKKVSKKYIAARKKSYDRSGIQTQYLRISLVCQVLSQTSTLTNWHI